ncbi:MAG: HAD-IA family hydrolase [Chloroflexi bacterium]|nr:HAD-IA family hydrolase [Chloroflexota bacterium]
MTRPRAVFFDAAGTLVYPHPSPAGVVEAVLRQWAPAALPLDGGALAAHIEAAMRACRQAGRLVHYPAAAALDFWRDAYRTFFGQQLAAAQAAAVADALLTAFTDLTTWRLFADVRPTLAALRPVVPTLGLLSNWEDWLPDLIVALEVRHLLDHLLVSGAIGLEKPDPAIFQRALCLAGVAPDEFVYVGDSLHHDIEPCQALGLRAVLIDRDGRLADVAGAVRLTDLRQLPAALGLDLKV